MAQKQDATLVSESWNRGQRNLCTIRGQAKDMGQNEVGQDAKRERWVGFLPSIDRDQEMCRGKARPEGGRKPKKILPALPLPHHQPSCSPLGSIDVSDSLEIFFINNFISKISFRIKSGSRVTITTSVFIHWADISQRIAFRSSCQSRSGWFDSRVCACRIQNACVPNS